MDKHLIQKVYSDVNDSLNQIYTKRKRALFYQRIMWAITGVYFVFMILNIVSAYFYNVDNSLTAFFKQFQATQNNPYANLYPVIGLIILLYPTTIVFTKTFQTLKIEENKTISKMVKLLFPKVEFTQGIQAPSKEIAKSKLFAWVNSKTPMFSYGQIRSSGIENTINIADIGIVEDNVSNKLVGVLIRIPGINMVVILYQYVLKNVFTKKTSDNVYYTFRGMFCWLRFKKKLKGHTIILTKNNGVKLDRISSFNFTDEQIVNLEDPRFTDEFIVYSTDQVEARYVLSIALMERIVNLKNKFNQPMLLSFHNQQMYLAVENKHGLFSFSANNFDSVEIIEELAHDIETALQISSQLKLQ